MKIKISKRDQSLLLLFAALAVLAISYFGIYQKNVQRALALQEENETLEKRVNELEEKVLEKDVIIADTAQKREKIAEITMQFPEKVTTEKAIVLLDELEKKFDFTIHSEGFMMNGEYWQGSKEGEEIKAFCSTVNISYETTYQGLKQVLDYIKNYGDRMTVTNVTTAYSNETGELTGNMTIAMYSLLGEGQEYKEPVIGNIRYGINNIFRTGE